MAYAPRNVKEGLGQFLASIGDIQRQHEVYQMENQREEDRKTELKSRLETDALNRTLANAAEGRAGEQFGWNKEDRPLERQAKQNTVTAGGLEIDSRRTQLEKGNVELGDYKANIAPGGRRDVERQLSDNLVKAQTAHARMGTAASAAQLKQAEMEAKRFQEQQAVRTAIGGMPFDDSQTWTNEMVDAVGGPQNTPMAIGGRNSDRAERAIAVWGKEIADWKATNLGASVPQHLIDNYNAQARILGYPEYSEGLAPGKSGTGGIDLRSGIAAVDRLTGNTTPPGTSR